MRTSMDKLFELASFCRAVETTMNMNDVIVLLIVAKEPGITVDGVWRSLGREITNSTVSRIISRMSDKDEHSGHGFIRLEHTASDGRLRKLYLTQKGSKFVQQLRDLVS